MQVGVIVGRFQVPSLHSGHTHLLRTVCSSCDRVLVLLGVSPVDGRCANNPFAYHQREHVVRGWLHVAKFDNVTVMPLLDQRNDKDWCHTLDTLLDTLYPGEQVKLFHGRASGFVKCYSGHYTTQDVPSDVECSGREVRAGIREGFDRDFMNGQAYALHHQYPHAYPCVDVAIVRSMRDTETQEVLPHVLLIKRADTGIWCFPGGFVDPTDKSLEYTVAREMQEELGLEFAVRATYISSSLQQDWRYRGSRDKIISSFFAVPYLSGPVTANPDEVVDIKWVSAPVADGAVADTHKDFARDLHSWFLTHKL